MPRKRIDEFIAQGTPGIGRETGRRAREPCPEDIEKILDTLNYIVGRLEAIEAELSRLRRAIEVRGEGRSGGLRRAGRTSGRSRLREVLREYKFVMASESRSRLGLSPQRLRSEAASEGLIIVDAGGDFAVMTPSSFEEFRALLSSVTASDPEEAAKEMGEYGRLFQALRLGGQVYYDARKRRWRLLEA